MLADDLLSQAHRLARLEPRRPKQASLRRAVSTAYYAVFHLLTDAAATRFLGAPARDLHRNVVRRAFAHGQMVEACKMVAGGTLAGRAAPHGVEISEDVREVARHFVFLQDERHSADYNVLDSFTRARVDVALQAATDALAAWRRVRNQPDADLLLLTMLFGAKRVH